MPYLSRKPVIIGGVLVTVICLIAFLLNRRSPVDRLDMESVARLPKTIDFNYHVKPILSDKCFACHGPDEKERKAGLRLDDPKSALEILESGFRAVIPRNTRRSTLIKRIFSDDPELQMPPPESHLSLTEYEKALLTRWIQQGAVYQEHWSFIPPRRPALPGLQQNEWPKNPIDHFVLARLEREGMQPAPEADKITLLRRVSFDLTGLPPSLEEIDNFLEDTSVNAYEKVVDRLLASPSYGERMALEWMDIARYADSHGYHADGYRMMWPWRDWVIKVFNENLPYDQFVNWQLAGDLLPDAGQEQKLATAFMRNNPINSELGIVPEEYRVENVIDRTNTFAKAFLGLTLECAQCHDHKYDPFSQKEYYQLSAYFNQVDELGMVPNDGNTAPTMPLMNEEVEAIVEFLQKEIKQKETELDHYRQQAGSTIVTQQFQPAADWQTRGRTAYFSLEEEDKSRFPNLAQKGLYLGFSKDAEVVPGYRGQGLHFNSEYAFGTLQQQGDFERTDAFSMGAWVKPEVREPYTVVLGNAGAKNNHWRGYELILDSLNRVQVRMVHSLPEHCLYVSTVDSIPVREWSHIFFTYDGSSKAEGITVYIDGKIAPVRIIYNRLYKSIRTIDDTLHVKARPIRVGRSYDNAIDLGLFQGAVDEITVYERELSALEVAGLTGNTFWQTDRPDTLDKDQRDLLADYQFRTRDTTYHRYLQRLQQLRTRIHTTLDTLPEIMVMRDMDHPRQTFVLERGLYNQHGEVVEAGTPQGLPKIGADLPPNRLGLAQWLTNPEHPLMARVTVNRYWHLLFGQGIVSTLEDFGNQGALPSHPELLDWLAVEFIESGWDLKHMLRLIVTSATYRQSSVVSQDIYELDPQNVLLARGPKGRLSAETIRDNILAASGLLVEQLGGPSVKTHQPEGLWSKTHFSRLLTRYEADQGPDLYRRSMYTFIRRTAPPPTMTILDAPDRDRCIVRRQRTSTPLQALLQLNEHQMIEAARVLAARVIKEGGATTDQQLDYAFRLLTSRHLLPEELTLMQQLYQEEYRKYQQDTEGATALLAVGDYPNRLDSEPARHAALTVVANIMMNYDEVYTKR